MISYSTQFLLCSSKKCYFDYVTGHRSHIREWRLRRMIKARFIEQREQIQKFKVPAELNFDATEQFEMIDWTDVVITELPVIKTMTDVDLRQFIAIQVTPTILFRKFLCHTQAVERVVKLVTQAFKVVCAQKLRDGFIRAQITSR